MKYVYIHPKDGVKAYDGDISLPVLQKLVGGRITILPISATYEDGLAVYINDDHDNEMNINPYVHDFLLKIGYKVYYPVVHGPAVIVGINDEGENMDIRDDIHIAAK